MATYSELLDIYSTPIGDNLKKRVRIAVVVAVDVVRKEPTTTPNHAARLLWAKNVLSAPDVEVQKMLWAVLAQNREFTVVQITQADDATVQAAVNGAIDLLAEV